MNHWSLNQLDIIGFASVLEKPTLPRILAPVFRHREQPATVLLPPLCISGDEVFKATVASMEEVSELQAQNQITMLPEALAARTNHDLWVNVAGAVAYDPKSAVKRALGDIFTEHLARANAALTAQDFEAAAQEAAIARAVRPTHLDPLVIRGAAERCLGQSERYAFTRHVASEYVDAAKFDRLVTLRTGAQPLAEAHGAGVMRNAALRKPRAAMAA